MSNEQENYRPRSPDLSEFVPRGNNPPHLACFPSYHNTSDSSFPPGYAFSPRGSYDASPYFPPHTTVASYFTTPSQIPPTVHRNPTFPPDQQYNPSLLSRTAPVDEPLQQRYQQQQQQQQCHTFSSPASHLDSTFSSPQRHFSSPNNGAAAMPTTRGKRTYYYEPQDSDQDQDQNQDYVDHAQASASAPPSAPSQAQPAAPAAVPTGPLELSLDVKTKFAVARIKRIMQADEDIGKVAQATPTAMAKALELFMIALITKGAAEARQPASGAGGGGGGGKRITAQHLKSALMTDPQFDFLSEQCANVPDESAGGGKKGRAKSEAKSEDSMDEEGAPPPPKKRGRGAAKREHDD